MNIAINGFTLNRTAEGDESVGQVLAELKDEIRAAGKVLTGVALDGKPLPDGWQRRQRLASAVANHTSLDLLINAPENLRSETLGYTAQMLAHLTEQTKPLARKFRLGDEFNANTELAAFLENLKLVVSGIDHVTRQSNDLTDSGPMRLKINATANTLLPALDRIYKAQAVGDYIAIADEFEYELPEHLANLSSLATEIAAKAPSRPIVASIP